jgi:hypothetical protein
MPVPGIAVTAMRYPLIQASQYEPPHYAERSAGSRTLDRRYPEGQNALDRRQHPGWLEERKAFDAEYYGERHWQRIERYLDGAGGLSLVERSEGLYRHEELIRPLIEATG